MESKKTKKTTSSEYGAVTPTLAESPMKYSAKELLGFPVIRALFFSGFALSFMATAYDVLFVLFCYSPVLAGGLAFSVSPVFLPFISLF